jgi:hypothetical protein
MGRGCVLDLGFARVRLAAGLKGLAGFLTGFFQPPKSDEKRYLARRGAAKVRPAARCFSLERLILVGQFS